MKNICVIFGGKSVEHDISIITALQTMKNLSKNLNLIPVYIKSDGRMVTAQNLSDERVYLDYQRRVKNEREIIFLPASGSVAILKNGKIKNKTRVDCALLCNHGHGGEDGSLQGFLEMADVPYTSCSVASSALCMDKVLTKQALSCDDILSPAYVHFDISEYARNMQDIENRIAKKIKFPCIVKPACGGSSVGIGICEDENMLKNTIENAALFDNKIIIEKYIQNASEYCCAVMKSRRELIASKVVKVAKGEFFSFEEKYLKEKEGEKEKIAKPLEKKIKTLAQKVYSALECDGVVRVDFLCDESGEIYVNEVNTIPGSLAFNLFDIPFKDLLNNLISEGIIRHKERAKIEYKFSSSAIESYIATMGRAKTKP